MESLLFHPKVVHLPIALAVLMPLIAGGLLLAWWREWLPGRAWFLAVALQLVLVVSGVVALSTGENDEHRVERVVAEQHISAHEHAAKRFVVASGVVLGLMLLGAIASKRREGRLAGAVATLGTVGVLAFGYQTGQAGGELVYSHGAAQAYQGAPLPGSRIPGETGAAKPARVADEDDD